MPMRSAKAYTSRRIRYDASMPRLPAGIVVVLGLVIGSGVVSLAQRFGVIEGTGAGIRVPSKDFSDGGTPGLLRVRNCTRASDYLISVSRVIGPCRSSGTGRVLAGTRKSATRNNTRLKRAT